MIKVYEYFLPVPYKSQAKTRRSDALMTINVQRNLHFNAAANFKNGYGAKCLDALPDIPLLVGAKLTYTLHVQPTKGKPTKAEPFRGSEPKNLDLTNLLAVVDKVNLDELVKKGILVDDSIRYVQEICFKVNPWSDTDFVSVEVTEAAPIPDPRKKKYDNNS